MANIHLRNINRALPNFFYIGQTGVDAVPLVPWAKRRQALIERLATYGNVGMPVNVKYAIKTNTREPDSTDLQRLIREGFAQMTGKTRGEAGRKQHRCVRLTDAGKLRVPSIAGID